MKRYCKYFNHQNQKPNHALYEFAFYPIRMKKSAFITYLCIGIFSFILTVSCTLNLIVTGVNANTQSKLDETNNTIAELRKKQAELSDEYSNLSNQMQLVDNRIYGLQKQIQEKQEQINEVEGQIDELDKEIAKQYQAMKLRIQYMYENGNSNFMDVLFHSSNLSDFLAKTEYAIQISTYDHDMLAHMNTMVNEMKAANDTLAADMSSLQELYKEAETESAKLSALIANNQKELSQSSEDIEKFEQLALEYEKQLEQERIAEEIKYSQQGSQNGVNHSGNNGAYVTGNGIAINHSASDLDMLAAIIECEAGNQPYEGRLAVASVIINRMNNPRFANSISEVIYSPGQFSPVASGRFAVVLSRGACDDCRRAAQDALNGNTNVDALYFIGYRGSIDDDKLKIGDHVFFTYWS